MPEEILIRVANRNDAAGILDCLESAFAPYRDTYTPEAFDDTTLTPATIQVRLASMQVYVAITKSGEIAGTIACSSLADEQEGHIRGMAVHPHWQGRAVAEKLLHTVEDRLLASGCKRISLGTTAPLQRAIRFYERNGFRPSGKVTSFFGMPLYEYVKLAQPK
jgi:ribosomal protein S18 acetylase RimI-like enzyme